MPLCLAAGALAAKLAVESFTLAWTHSIEKIRWEEDWRIEAGQLRIVEARIRGTGAGMEPPEGALLKDGVWHYRPRLMPQDTLMLTHTPYAEPHELCFAGRCANIESILPGLGPSATLHLSACKAG